MFEEVPRERRGMARWLLVHSVGSAVPSGATVARPIVLRPAGHPTAGAAAAGRRAVRARRRHAAGRGRRLGGGRRGGHRAHRLGHRVRRRAAPARRTLRRAAAPGAARPLRPARPTPATGRLPGLHAGTAAPAPASAAPASAPRLDRPAPGPCLGAGQRAAPARQPTRTAPAVRRSGRAAGQRHRLAGTVEQRPARQRADPRQRLRPGHRPARLPVRRSARRRAGSAACTWSAARRPTAPCWPAGQHHLRRHPVPAGRQQLHVAIS